MPRLNLIRSREHYYFIAIRSKGGSGFYVSRVRIRSLAKYHLLRLEKELEVQTEALTFPENQIEFLIHSPKADIGRVMHLFMNRLGRDLRRSSGRINRIFGGAYKGCLIEKPQHLDAVRHYLIQKEVTASSMTDLESQKICKALKRTVFRL